MGKKEVQNMTPKVTKIFQNGSKMIAILSREVTRRPRDSYVFGPKKPLKKRSKKGSKKGQKRPKCPKMTRNESIFRPFLERFLERLPAYKRLERPKTRFKNMAQKLTKMAQN
jgi:hypothetical protein